MERLERKERKSEGCPKKSPNFRVRVSLRVGVGLGLGFSEG